MRKKGAVQSKNEGLYCNTVVRHSKIVHYQFQLQFSILTVHIVFPLYVMRWGAKKNKTISLCTDYNFENKHEEKPFIEIFNNAE